MQDEAPLEEYCPAAHSAHEVALPPPPAVPGLHATHEPEARYCPALHDSTQADADVEPAGEVCPLGQLVHDEAPVEE